VINPENMQPENLGKKGPWNPLFRYKSGSKGQDLAPAPPNLQENPTNIDININNNIHTENFNTHIYIYI